MAVAAIAFDPKAAPGPLNLGMLARPGVTDIPSDGVQTEFQLVIAQTIRKTSTGSEYYTVSQILQRGVAATAQPAIVAAMTLFNGIRFEGGQ